MTKPIVFLGGSQQIAELADVCELTGQKIAGIVDSDYYGNTADYRGIPYIGSEETFDFVAAADCYDFFVSTAVVLGYQRNLDRRRHFIDLVDRYCLPCANIIDPQCRISKSAKLGQGIYAAFCCNIGYDCVISNYCVIHHHATVGHNSTLGENTVLQRYVGCSSNLTTGENVIVSHAAKLLGFPKMTVGNNAVIYPAMSVMRDINDNEVVKINSRRVYRGLIDNGDD